MPPSITVTISPERDRVRLLAREDQSDILKAVLAPACRTHPRAAATFLEGLSLWYQRRLSVVLSASESPDDSALALYDALGIGTQTMHYQVGVAWGDRRRGRPRVIRGLGDFRDLRQLSLLGDL